MGQDEQARDLLQAGARHRREATNLLFLITCGELDDSPAMRDRIEKQYALAADCWKGALKTCGRDMAITLLLDLAELYAGEEQSGYDPRRALYYTCLSYSLAKQRRQQEGGRSNRVFYEERICDLCGKSGKTVEDDEVLQWKSYYQNKGTPGDVEST